MKKLKLNNCILIAGSGRNVGKTSLSCHLIQQLVAKGMDVVAFKVSKHKHVISELVEPIMNRPNIFIGRENDAESTKDSSRYIRAGASQSYFVLASDESIHYLLDYIHLTFSNKFVVVIESTLFGAAVEPGLAFFVNQPQGGKVCSWSFKHHVLPAMVDGQAYIWPEVGFVDGGWMMVDG